MGAEMTSADYY